MRGSGEEGGDGVGADNARRARSSASKWWLTITRKDTCCARCAGVLRTGREMVYRHSPREALCKLCAESDPGAAVGRVGSVGREAEGGSVTVIVSYAQACLLDALAAEIAYIALDKTDEGVRVEPALHDDSWAVLESEREPGAPRAAYARRVDWPAGATDVREGDLFPARGRRRRAAGAPAHRAGGKGTGLPP